MSKSLLSINKTCISRQSLVDLYLGQKKSVFQISKLLGCSENKINYWLSKYGVSKRSISEAVYTHKNPNGDPFKFTEPDNIQKAILYGLGLGLYWGEGLKRGKGGVRITNTDSRLLLKFIEFLEIFFNINKEKLRFGLQIFDDISPEKSLQHWVKVLGVNKDQFYKIVVSKIRGDGTYKNKSEFGVVIVYFNNIKLKRIICNLIDNFQ